VLRSVISRFPSGVLPILVGTAIAGVVAYAINLLVPIRVAPVTYSQFSIIWSVLYFCLAALAGVQQEVTRATRPKISAVGGKNPIIAFALVGTLCFFIVVLAGSYFALPLVVGENLEALALPVAISAGCYVLFVVLGGTLSGLQRWRWLALMVSLDALARLVAVAVAAFLSGSIFALIWAVALPFPLVPMSVWLLVRRRVNGKFELDVPLPRLSWNSLRALAAAAASGILITGFPLLLAATSLSTPKQELAGVNLAVMLVRSPLVVLATAMQGYLVVHFRGGGHAALVLLGRVSLAIAGVSVAVAVLAFFVAPPIFRLFGPSYSLEGWFFGLLVLASGLLGIVCVAASYLLAVSRHSAFLLMWIVAAVVTVVVLLLPIPLHIRSILSLVAGPAAGVITGLVFVAQPARESRRLEQ
jgi:hypothetical protein